MNAYLTEIKKKKEMAVPYLLHMTGCMGKRVFCDMGGNFEKCTF